MRIMMSVKHWLHCQQNINHPRHPFLISLTSRHHARALIHPPHIQYHMHSLQGSVFCCFVLLRACVCACVCAYRLRLLSWGDSCSPGVVSDLVLLNELLSHVQTERKLPAVLCPPPPPNSHSSSLFLLHMSQRRSILPTCGLAGCCCVSQISFVLIFAFPVISAVLCALCIQSLGFQWRSSVSEVTLPCNCHFCYNSSTYCDFCYSGSCCVHLHFVIVEHLIPITWP